MFKVNQIVRGKKAGVFVVLALRTVTGIEGVQVKPVNPNNIQESGEGEFFLPLDALVDYSNEMNCSADYRQ